MGANFPENSGKKYNPKYQDNFDKINWGKDKKCGAMLVVMNGLLKILKIMLAQTVDAIEEY